MLQHCHESVCHFTDSNQSSDILQHSQNRPTGYRWLKLASCCGSLYIWVLPSRFSVQIPLKASINFVPPPLLRVHFSHFQYTLQGHFKGNNSTTTVLVATFFKTSRCNYFLCSQSNIEHKYTGCPRESFPLLY